MGKIRGAHLPAWSSSPTPTACCPREAASRSATWLTTPSKISSCPAELTEVTVDNADLAALKLESLKYYTPTDPCFPVIDSWTLTEMFQMSVSVRHPMKSTSKHFKALKDKGPKRIIFVVPKKIADDFKIQDLVLVGGTKPTGGGLPAGGWNDVQQFVLGL